MRDNSMFDFLVGDVPTKTVDLELISEFAKQAASAYLGQSKIPLNETITKIATVERLNSDHVSIVCQEANKLVNTSLFKTAEDKYTQFDLADAEVVVSSLEGSEKTASVNQDLNWDYASGPDKTVSSTFVMTKTAGHDGLKVPEAHVKRVALEKIASQKQELADEILIHNATVEGLENKFVKIARNQLLPLGLNERRDMFPYIAQFCKEAGLSQNKTEHLIGYLDKVMVRQGLLEKSADLKADPSLISDKLNARVVNGTHPLFMVIKTIKEEDDKDKLYKERHNIIKEKIEHYGSDGAIVGVKDVKRL